jgi:hypothetical protein
VAALTIVNGAPSAVYVGTDDGLYRSSDGGLSWRQLLAGVSVRRVARSGAAPAIIYLATDQGVYRSNDGGTTWGPQNDGLLSPDVRAIVIDPLKPSTVYAGTAKGISKSKDSGTSWHSADAGVTSRSIRSLVHDPAHGGVLYAGTDNGIFKTVSGGGGWSAANDGIDDGVRVHDLVIHASDTDRVFAATSAGVFRSYDAAGNWSSYGALAIVQTWCLAFSPGTSANLYAGTAKGLYAKMISAADWSSLPLVVSLSAQEVAADPAGAGGVTAGGEVGWQRSSDNGSSWNSCAAEELRYEGLRPDPGTPARLFALDCSAGSCRSVVRSSDSCGSWQEVFPPQIGTTVTLVLPLSLYTYVGTSVGLYRSENGGVSWSPASNGMEGGGGFPAISYLAENPANDSVLIAVTSKGVYRSANNGTLWVGPLSWLTGYSLEQLAIDPLVPGRLFALARQGTEPLQLFRSIDNGTTWQPLTVATDYAGPFTPTAITFSLQQAGLLYLGTAEGTLLRSTNGGIAWSELTKGLPRRPVTSLSITRTAEPETIYAGLNNGGVQTYTDSSPDPALAVSDRAISFLPTEVGATASEEIYLASVGTGPVTVTSLTISGSGNFTRHTLSKTLPAVLVPGQHLSFTVTFSPGVVGSSSAVLTVVSTDPDRPLISVPLAATAIPVAPLHTTATPPAGTYLLPQNVVLSANKPAIIYYTTDGSTPSTGSDVYTAPIPIAATTTLSYFARQESGTEEAVHTSRYVIGTGTGTGSLSIMADEPYVASAFVEMEVLRPTADYVEMQFSVNGTTWTPWEPFWPVRRISLPLGDGVKTVWVRFRDSGGTLYPLDVSDTIILDTKPPLGTIAINGGDETTIDPLVTLSLAAVDVNGVTHMRLSKDGLTWTPWEPYTASRSFTLKTGTGARRVYVRFRDAASNASATLSDVILLKTEPPPPLEDGGVAINDDAVYTGSAAVKLTLTPPVGAAQMSFSRNGTSAWSTWEKVVPLRSYTLASGDGEKSVYVRFRDSAKVLLGMYGDAIILDSRPPLGFVSINNGDENTSNPQVTLALGAVDVNGVAEMQISTGTDWSDVPWEPFAASRLFDFPVTTPGVKTVYVRFRDEGGGKVSAVYKDTIRLLAP